MDDKIIDIRSKRTEAIEEPKGPPNRNYKIVMEANGVESVIEATGYLIATTAFVAIAQGEGEFQVVVPIGYLKYVQAI